MRQLAAEEQPATPSHPSEPSPVKSLPTHAATPVALTSTFNPSATSRGSHKHSPAQDAKNRVSGESAEKVVLASLIATYTAQFVEHVAHRHDGAGYDIRYSPDQGVTWRYAEVKRYTQNCIHLSSNEYRFAAANRDKYELLLVTATDEIHCLRDIDFGDSARFGVVASEYVVSFSLEEGNTAPDHATATRPLSEARIILIEEAPLMAP